MNEIALLNPGLVFLRNFPELPTDSGRVARCLQVPVEMAVLWSQLILSQNGIVDATALRNVVGSGAESNRG